MSSQNTPTPTTEARIVAPDQSAVESMVKGEVDIAVVTARKFPRSVRAFMDTLGSLVTLDQETAEACFYALPREGKMIDGPSARFAELAASAWGNMRADARLVGVDDRFVTMRGSAWDLEKNVLISYEVQRRITGKNSKRYSDDMIMVTANAAGSISLRNAVLKVIPAPFWRPLYLKARAAAAGDEKTLKTSRAAAVDFFVKRGVPADIVFARLEVKGIEDVQLHHVTDLRGMATALKDGDTTLAELFPEVFKGESSGPREKKDPTPAAATPTTPATETPATPETPAATPTPAADALTVTDIVEQVGGSRPWWIATFSDGRKAYTFSTTVATTLTGAKAVGAAVVCTFKVVNFTIPLQLVTAEVANG